MRVAFFGGTFDPPHRGHLEVAKAAADRFGLDQVLLVPAGVQPLRQEAPAASYAARLQMTRLLCEEDFRLAASDLDAPLASGEPNYTVDSLRRLKQHLPADTGLYAIAGGDAFLGLRRWKEPGELLQLVDWIVVSRPGFTLGDLGELRLSPEQRLRVQLLHGISIPISASEVRRRLRAGERCDEWLAPSVAEYIREHHLYSESTADSVG